MKKNVASQVITAQLVSSSDGSDVTSGTTTVYVLGDGGTQGSGSGTVAHEGNGTWSYIPTQAETNYDHIAFTFVNSSAVSALVQVYTTFPQSVDNATNISAIKAKTDNLPASPAAVGSQMDLVSAPNGTAVAAIQNGLATESGGNLAAVKAKTDNLPADPADASDIAGAFSTLTSYGDSNWATATGFSTFDPTTDTVARVTLVDTTTANTDLVSAADVATAVLTTQMTESYAANGTAPTLAQAQFAIHQMLMQFGISGTSITVKKLDDSTTAFVVTLDDATSPTAASRT